MSKPNAVLARLVDDRDKVSATIDDVLEAVAAEERDPTDSERELLQRSRGRLGELEPQIVELVELEEQRNASRDARGVLEPNGPARTTSIVPTAPAGADAPVYRSFHEYARDELIRRYDVIASRAGRGAREHAEERLTRAVVNTITTDVPGLTVPQHLAQIVDVIDKSRPVVAASRSGSLTSGTITYPKITGRPTVAHQAAEKTAVSSTKMTVALETANAKVFAGAGDLSWQAINWTTPDALALYFDLMAEAYAQATELEACTVLGAGGLGGPVTVASDDLAGWYGAIAEAAGSVYVSSGRPANAVVADVSTGFHLLGMVGNTSPTFGNGGSINLQGSGSINGLQLIVTRGFTGTTAIVGDMNALLVAESGGAPVELRAVEPSLAGMEVGVVGGFLAERLEDSAFVALTPPAGGTTRSAGNGGGK